MLLSLVLLGGWPQPSRVQAQATLPTVAAEPPQTAGDEPSPPLPTQDPDALEQYILEQIRLRAAESRPAAPTTRPAEGHVPVTRPATPRPPAAPPQPTTGPSATAPATTGTPRLELSPTEFDFKEVWPGDPAEGEFTIRNAGTAPLTLETKSSCGCTVVSKPKPRLEPGETTTFKISYTTTRAGTANKSVYLTTNDPEQRSVTIKVVGTVRALVAATPSDRIAFHNLDIDSVESKTVRLETKHDQPLPLKLRPDQNFESFVVELKEIEAGRVYDLTVTTRPPLRPNLNAVTVQLDTGHEKVPTFPVQVTANVTPPVAISPPRLTVVATTGQRTEQIVRLESRTTEPVRITEVKPSIDAIEWEILPLVEPPAESRTWTQQVRLTLPPYADLPPGGATVQVLTDAADEQYREIKVPVVRAPSARPTTRPAPRGHG